MEQKEENSLSQISAFPLKESTEPTWKVCFNTIDWFRPLKFLLQWLHRGCSWLRCLFTTKPLDSNKRQPAIKRLGTVAQILFAIIPVRLQLALGFLHTVCQSIEVEETLKSPGTPSKRGSKRKTEDVKLDEPQCWIETILKDLPDNDDSEDLTYELTKSETDSEEYKSQNDTEGDLEYEEKDGLLILKEDPVSPQGQNGEGTAAETPQTADAREELVASQISGDDNKHPEHHLLMSSGTYFRKSLESTEIVATSIQGSDIVDSNDYEEIST
ncbi:uncharacterized protein LOC120303460 [Crotalus tigris]|uniref:uncharacterized protein LOC120303460 n=1 Tax=Crotalus tigris TaxID=88082 RepID=UPI00192F1F2C|nr:uncharacterized protein LOC120303460 [Crotalus tigris]